MAQATYIFGGLNMATVFGKIFKKEGKKIWLMLDQNSDDFVVDNAMMMNNNVVALNVDDGVSITNAQRKFSFAVMRDIFEAQYGGYDATNDGWLVTEESVRQHFYSKYFERYGEEFTLSASKGRKYDANNFIDILMEFVDDNGVMIKDYRPLEYMTDKAAYKHCYRALMNSTCAICGKPHADLHHVDTIGIGNNRDKVNHLGRYAIELCRKHHNELDSPNHDQKEFIEKYHLAPVKINELIAKKHNLNMNLPAE